MKKTILLLSFALFYVNMSFGQGISNIWMGGYANFFGAPPWGGWKMDFIAGPPVITYENRAIDFNITGTTIADSSGNFLFATNGVTIINSASDTMLNGTGLSPSTYSSPQWYGDGLRIPQATLILPMPGSTNLYYLFHSTIDTINIPSYAYYFYYSLIDMSLDSGKGVVVAKNQVIQTGLFATGGISGCMHANGRDWWISIHDKLGSELHFFLLTPFGVTYSHSQSIGFRDGLGTYSFSPDGSKFGGYNTVDDFEIFDFDRCSGMLSNYRKVIINDSIVSFGSAFSPNSKYLYGASIRYLYQVDVTSNQPDTTLITVANWDSTWFGNYAATFALPALAPDGKIYITTGSVTSSLHTIEEPDNPGIACNVIQNSVTLPSYNRPTVPNHPNYFLGPLVGSLCDSLVGLNELSLSPIKIQPNPTQGLFQIAYPPQSQNGSMELIDLFGKIIVVEQIPPWSQLKNVDISELSSGIYILKIRWGNNVVYGKVMKE
ncbi:MAG: T9SS type A sorting domain-containing protein [Bacteroidetes bacterium]|nr:T9SS type A sorting domain-containing protein [Bacteroidota bacterium]